MFEFNDDFLMGPNRAGLLEEGAGPFCNITKEAEDQLAELASLVGRGSKLQSSTGSEQIELVDSAPALEFDLEDELSKAFQTQQEPQTVAEPQTPVSEPVQAEAASIPVTPVMDYSDPAAEVLPTPELSAMEMEISAVEEPALPAEAEVIAEIPAAPLDALEMGDEAQFEDMIAEELDRAFAEEAAADPDLVTEGAVDAQNTDQAAFNAELAKLMGDAVEPASDPAVAAALTAPPVPEVAQEPWQTPEIVDAPAIPSTPDFAVETQSAPDLQAPQMSDFETSGLDYSDPAADFQPFESEPSPALSPSKENAVHIESVLGGAAALGAAAHAEAAKPAPKNVPQDLEQQLSAAFESSMELDNPDDDFVTPEVTPAVASSNKGQSGRRAAFAIVAVALLGGTAALGWNIVNNDDTKTPVLLASTEPVKVKPKDAGGKVVPNQDQAVYKDVEGQDSKVVKQAKLKDDTEKPIAVAVGKTDARATQSQKTQADGLDLQPRRVRTVVVKPDGTIVSTTADQTTAANTSGVEIKTPTLALQPQTGGLTTAATAPISPTVSSGTQKVSFKVPTAQTEEQVAAKTVETKPVKVAEVKAEPKPVKKAVKPVVAKKPVKKPVAKAATENLPSTASPFAVQISSQRSSAAAKQSYANLSRRYASVLGGKGVDIRKAVVTGKGTYYRVRIPAQSRSAANSICNQLKARGGDCFVTR